MDNASASRLSRKWCNAKAHCTLRLLIPVPGGVLIKDSFGTILGAAGASGDTSDNDEAALIAAIKAVGFAADGG